MGPNSDDQQFKRLQKLEAQAEEEFRVLVGKEFCSLETIEADLDKAGRLLRCELEARGSFLSSFDWLLFLRSVWSQRLLFCSDESWETAHHAEYFTALSQKKDSDSQPVDRGLRPEVVDLRFRRLAQFVAGCFVWRQLRVFRSLLSFEVEFEVDAGGIPKPRPRPDQQANIDVLNKRIGDIPMILVTGAGLAVSTGDTDSEETTFVYIGRDGPESFGIGFFGIGKFRQLCSKGLVKPEHVQTICDLLLTLKVGYLVARNAAIANGLKQSGLVRMETSACPNLFAQAEKITSALAEMFPDTWAFGNPDNLVQRLQVVGLDLQFGPPIRQADNWFVMDLFSASSLLDHLLFRGFSKYCGDRGPLFEDDVQELIDVTPWKPSDEVRRLRGRTVKDGDRSITDLDAIGVKDGVLLVVECKAKFYGLSYGPSTRQEIRNVREEVEMAVRKCDSNKLRSATSPNLAQFSKVMRTVCTPTPVYVEAGYAIPKEGGFPDSTSYWELGRLLMR